MTTAPAVLVTGAASGMGFAFAKRFLVEGWRVIAIDIDPQALSAKADELGDLADGYVQSVADVRDRAQIHAAIEASGLASSLAAAVPAAGVFPPTTLADYDLARYRATFDINVLGTLHTVAEAVDAMRASGIKGSIVTISSVAGYEPSAGQVLYGASKSAVVSLTKTLATTLAPEDIVVNGIAPGWVMTPGNIATGRIIGAEASIPLGRVAEPDELAAWVWLLASRQSVGYLTGQTIKVSGGLAMS